MRKDIAATLAVLALAAVAVSAKPAAAGVRPFAREGAWTAITGISEDGKPMCGMYVLDRTADRTVYFKNWQGNPYITMQVFKTSWRIPKGTEIKVRLLFDGKFFSEGTAIGRPMENNARNDGKSLVEIDIKDRDLMQRFASEFAEADKMVIDFPEGNEAPWEADMTGSRTIGNHFWNCVRNLRPSTQPYGRQPEAGTQPFNRDKLPTPTPDRGV